MSAIKLFRGPAMFTLAEISFDQKFEPRIIKSVTAPVKPAFLSRNHAYTGVFEFPLVKDKIDEVLTGSGLDYGYSSDKYYTFRVVHDVENMVGEIRIFCDPTRNNELLVEVRRMSGENRFINMADLLGQIICHIKGNVFTPHHRVGMNKGLHELPMDMELPEAPLDALKSCVDHCLDRCDSDYVDVQELAGKELYSYGKEIGNIRTPVMNGLLLACKDRIMNVIKKMLVSHAFIVREIAMTALCEFFKNSEEFRGYIIQSHNMDEGTGAIIEGIFRECAENHNDFMYNNLSRITKELMHCL